MGPDQIPKLIDPRYAGVEAVRYIIKFRKRCQSNYGMWVGKPRQDA